MNTSIRWLDWRFVRSLGELQILTRASYAMLGVVPILAGLWNALPLGEPRSHYLTHTWVFAFFAALGVTFGQVIYQTLAPEIVRRSTREQFVREKRDEYVKQPSRDLLEAADLALDRNTHQQLSFPRFVYYYPPVENIIKTEALIGEAIKTANRMNEDTVNKLGSLFY